MGRGFSRGFSRGFRRTPLAALTALEAADTATFAATVRDNSNLLALEAADVASFGVETRGGEVIAPPAFGGFGSRGAFRVARPEERHAILRMDATEAPDIVKVKVEVRDELSADEIEEQNRMLMLLSLAA